MPSPFSSTPPLVKNCIQPTENPLPKRSDFYLLRTLTSATESESPLAPSLPPLRLRPQPLPLHFPPRHPPFLPRLSSALNPQLEVFITFVLALRLPPLLQSSSYPELLLFSLDSLPPQIPNLKPSSPSFSLSDSLHSLSASTPTSSSSPLTRFHLQISKLKPFFVILVLQGGGFSEGPKEEFDGGEVLCISEVAEGRREGMDGGEEMGKGRSSRRGKELEEGALMLAEEEKMGGCRRLA